MAVKVNVAFSVAHTEALLKALGTVKSNKTIEAITAKVKDAHTAATSPAA